MNKMRRSEPSTDIIRKISENFWVGDSEQDIFIAATLSCCAAISHWVPLVSRKVLFGAKHFSADRGENVALVSFYGMVMMLITEASSWLSPKSGAISLGTYGPWDLRSWLRRGWFQNGTLKSFRTGRTGSPLVLPIFSLNVNFFWVWKTVSIMQ